MQSRALLSLQSMRRAMLAALGMRCAALAPRLRAAWRVALAFIRRTTLDCLQWESLEGHLANGFKLFCPVDVLLRPCGSYLASRPWERRFEGSSAIMAIVRVLGGAIELFFLSSHGSLRFSTRLVCL